MAGIKDLYSEYRRLAKRANQRLVRLEQFSEREGNRDVLRYAYKRAQRDIEAFRGEGFSRWSQNPAKAGTLEEIRMQISDINRFLESETSTIGRSYLQPGKAGIRDIYDLRAAQFNENMGTNFTGEQISTFMEGGGLYDILERQFGSDAYREIIQAGSMVMEKLKEEGKTAVKTNILRVLSQVKFDDNKTLDKEIRNKFKSALKDSVIKRGSKLI